MSDSTQLQAAKLLLGINGTGEDDLLNTYLRFAKQAILNKLYPFGNGNESLPRKYENKVVDIAVYLYSKQGSEGETAHNENGINRTYESAGIPNSYLNDIVPMAGGIS